MIAIFLSYNITNVVMSLKNSMSFFCYNVQFMAFYYLCGAKFLDYTLERD